MSPVPAIHPGDHPVNFLSLSVHQRYELNGVPCQCPHCAKARLKVIEDEALLDPLETNWQETLDAQSDSRLDPRPTDRRHPACDVSDVEFRHTGWHARRQSVLLALQAISAPPARISRFRECGANCWVLRDPMDHNRFRLAADYCHDRFCLPCARARSRMLAANLGRVIADSPHRFITLTLRSDDEPLKRLLDRLYESFARLRRRKLWRSVVNGGAAFCEVVWSPQSNRWHPHLHIIATGKYFPQQQLSDLWLDVTGDSYIVDVRLIRDRQTTLRYVTKYATKAYDESYVGDSRRLQEAITAFKGVRFCLTFGDWRGVPLTDRLDDTAWELFESLDSIRSRAHNGDDDALFVLHRVLTLRPWLDSPPPDPLLWDQ
jgi:hypothetical protein